MAKITGKYEVLYIIDPAQGEEGIAALVEKFKAMVEAGVLCLTSMSGASVVWLTRSTT